MINVRIYKDSNINKEKVNKSVTRYSLDGKCNRIKIKPSSLVFLYKQYIRAKYIEINKKLNTISFLNKDKLIIDGTIYLSKNMEYVIYIGKSLGNDKVLEICIQSISLYEKGKEND